MSIALYPGEPVGHWALAASHAGSSWHLTAAPGRAVVLNLAVEGITHWLMWEINWGPPC